MVHRGLAVLTALTVLAVRPSDGQMPKPGLPLQPDRYATFTTNKVTWMSLDVSPDGQTIVFDMLGDLYTVPITGGTATRLTSGLAHDMQPRFSPDGKRVVYISDQSGDDNVWIMSLDGKDTLQLTKGIDNDYLSPEWTPDGNYVVVAKGTPFASNKLWLYNVHGGHGLPLQGLTPTGRGNGSTTRSCRSSRSPCTIARPAPVPRCPRATARRSVPRSHPTASG